MKEASSEQWEGPIVIEKLINTRQTLNVWRQRVIDGWAKNEPDAWSLVNALTSAACMVSEAIQEIQNLKYRVGQERSVAEEAMRAADGAAAELIVADGMLEDRLP